MNPELVDALSRRRLILFAGSGLSAGLGLPTWGRLIEKMAGDLGYDASLFRGYGDPWTLAEYHVRRAGGVDDLCAWVETAWHAATIDIARSEAHRLIVEMAFPLIYTTTYDRWIELAHAAHGRDCASIIDVDDMASVPHDVVQMLKFHGDIRAPNSLVLTETDYFRRLALDSPLDLRLRADAFGRSDRRAGRRCSRGSPQILRRADAILCYFVQARG